MTTHFHRTCRLLIPFCGLLASTQCMNPMPAAAVTQTSSVIISAVLPNPSSGPEWVMLENRSSAADVMPHQTFLPLVMNHIAGSMPISTVGQPPTLSVSDIAGWRLGNGADWYTLPDDLPPLPAGAKLIVYFDGLGAAADDYDLSDGMAELHTPAGMVNMLPDTAGKVFLYASEANTPENLRAQYEWGIGIENRESNLLHSQFH